MLKKYAIINFKGGVGKTTITWLLGSYLHRYRNRKILL
ncbi:MAG: ParA family protein, partial [Leptonema sp. (in: bacteria)]